MNAQLLRLDRVVFLPPIEEAHFANVVAFLGIKHLRGLRLFIPGLFPDGNSSSFVLKIRFDIIMQTQMGLGIKLISGT